jgi:CheY-like chemotaxis protein
MADLRILVVEDTQNWQDALPRILQRLGGDVRVDVATDYGIALQYVGRERYDLAVVDLALLGAPTDPRESDQLGMELLRELRRSRGNRGCGLVVLTAYPTTARTRQAIRDYAAYDFIEKASYDDRSFVDTARAAILDARQKQAAVRASERYRLTVTFSQEHLIGSELIGPDRRTVYAVPELRRFPAADLARRADNLNLLALRGRVDMWRPEVRSFGEAVYQALASEHRILSDLTGARALAHRFSDLWLEFSGPAVGLSVPFELLRGEDDYLGLSHVLTRRLVEAGVALSRKPEPFHAFLGRLLTTRETLRILIVAANSDGNIPGVEAEATSLAVTIEKDLQSLGIAHEVTLLSSVEATYARVTEALRDGRYHIFHYAGHGRYDDKLPEISGLILPDDAGPRPLTAADLNLLVRDTELRLVYLSCCLGARTAQQVGRGDFQGMLEALTRADVPAVLGYRWTIADAPAMLLALVFYQMLWRSFSPGEALLEARRSAAMGERGRDDETWASPVLLMQNA